jgi:hypothetical protein
LGSVDQLAVDLDGWVLHGWESGDTGISARSIDPFFARVPRAILSLRHCGGIKERQRTMTALREKLVKIGAKVVMHSRYMMFQLAEVAVPRELFAALVERIGRLRLACASG